MNNKTTEIDYFFIPGPNYLIHKVITISPDFTGKITIGKYTKTLLSGNAIMNLVSH